MYVNRVSVYRLYDSSGALLYVGVAANPHRRWREHRRSARWWDRVDETRTRVEWHGGYRAAFKAEAAAIVNEMPLCNIVGSPNRARPQRERTARRFGGLAYGVTELRRQVPTRVDAAHFLKEPTIITKGLHEEPRAVLIPHDWYEVLVEALAERGITAPPTTAQVEE